MKELRKGQVPKLVLTGGPGAGKTVAAAEIARRLGTGVRHIPEAATQVYQRMGRTWDTLTLEERRAAQTAMYRLQLAQEDQAAADARRDGIELLLLDRGTIDGAGYWPDGPDQFWPLHDTTHDAELARYSAVIWLETAAALGLYDHKASNEIRFESAPQAVASGNLMAELWGSHPRLVRVGASTDFAVKLAEVEAAVRALVATR